MTLLVPEAQEVLTFWFAERNKSFWFSQSDEFDRLLTDKFAYILEQASAGELEHWRTTMCGRLAEIIVLDQFSRNIYRHTALYALRIKSDFLWQNIQPTVLIIQ